MFRDVTAPTGAVTSRKREGCVSGIRKTSNKKKERKEGGKEEGRRGRKKGLHHGARPGILSMPVQARRRTQKKFKEFKLSVHNPRINIYREV